MFDAQSTKYAFPFFVQQPRPFLLPTLCFLREEFTDDPELLRSVLREDELGYCSKSQLSSESEEL